VSEPAYDHEAIQALIQAYVACRVATGALPQLPPEIRAVVEAPVTSLCSTVGPVLERVRPGITNRDDS
jgi:hypothetical protein